MSKPNRTGAPVNPPAPPGAPAANAPPLPPSPAAAAPPKSDPLEGVLFADDPRAPDPTATVAAPPAVETPDQREARMRANDEAARRSIEQLSRQYTPSKEDVPLDLPKMTPEEVAAKQPKRYRVLEDREIARGASKVKLPAGKVIDTNGYDVEMLQQQGVRLQPI